MVKKISIEEINKFNNIFMDDIFILSSYLYENITKDECRKWFKLLLEQPNIHFFIAKSDNSKVLGMLTLISYPTIGGYQKTWIEDVVVSPEARRKGIGKKLVNEALKKAKKLKIKQVNLTSNPSRIIANKMYQKLKFTKYNTNYYHYIFKK